MGSVLNFKPECGNLNSRSIKTSFREDNFDLLVSNYALSECNRETQMMYIERFVKKSDKFYLMHNNFHADNGNMSYEEFIDVMSDTHDIEYYGEHGVEENPKVMFGVIK